MERSLRATTGRSQSMRRSFCGSGQLRKEGMQEFQNWPASGSLDLKKINWVAVKGLKLSYYIGETLLFTIYTHSDNLI